LFLFLPGGDNYGQSLDRQVGKIDSEAMSSIFYKNKKITAVCYILPNRNYESFVDLRVITTDVGYPDITVTHDISSWKAGTCTFKRALVTTLIWTNRGDMCVISVLRVNFALCFFFFFIYHNYELSFCFTFRVHEFTFVFPCFTISWSHEISKVRRVPYVLPHGYDGYTQKQRTATYEIFFHKIDYFQ
jgi:hypothetical protein